MRNDDRYYLQAPPVRVLRQRDNRLFAFSTFGGIEYPNAKLELVVFCEQEMIALADRLQKEGARMIEQLKTGKG